MSTLFNYSSSADPQISLCHEDGEIEPRTVTVFVLTVRIATTWQHLIHDLIYTGLLHLIHTRLLHLNHTRLLHLIHTRLLHLIQKVATSQSQKAATLIHTRLLPQRCYISSTQGCPVSSNFELHKYLILFRCPRSMYF